MPTPCGHPIPILTLTLSSAALDEIATRLYGRFRCYMACGSRNERRQLQLIVPVVDGHLWIISWEKGFHSRQGNRHSLVASPLVRPRRHLLPSEWLMTPPACNYIFSSRQDVQVLAIVTLGFYNHLGISTVLSGWLSTGSIIPSPHDSVWDPIRVREVAVMYNHSGQITVVLV